MVRASKFVLLFLLSTSLEAQSGAPLSGIVDSPDHLQNLGQLKTELKEYHDCAPALSRCYSKDLESQAAVAIAFLHRRVPVPDSSVKLAAVFDIDETALSNYPEMLADDFGYQPKNFDEWIQSAQAPAIPATLKIYREARRLGVSVFFITGRKEIQRDATERNLRAQGYSDWQSLTLRMPAQGKEPTIQY